MNLLRVNTPVNDPRSDLEILSGHARKKHANHPILLKEIEKILWEFQKRERSGEISDRSAFTQQFREEMARIGGHSHLPPKDPGPKPNPTPKTVRFSVSSLKSATRKGKTSSRRKRQSPKWRPK